MYKYRKNIIIILLILISLFLCSCKNGKEEDDIPPHEHVESEWKLDGEYSCTEEAVYVKVCTICGETLDMKFERVMHDFVYETQDPTCTEPGKSITTCKNCDYREERNIAALGHDGGKYVVTKEATKTSAGTRELRCTRCGELLLTAEYAANGFHEHGKLRVIGKNLCDKNRDKFQLYGLSYHGLQWFGRYVNRDTIIAIQNNFGVNVIRLACYSSEGGWAEGGQNMKNNYKKYIDTAIKTAAEIGLYVVVDWHMLGAEFEPDENPLYYLEDAKEFFEYVCSTYKDYDNVLYEIMNEPSGSATWKDCKDYANIIIPIIRKYTDAVVLVGNPHWSADLNSVMKDPLEGYSNIMYTLHFYADDFSNPSQVVNAWDKGFPVFITEYGFMNSDGDGDMNYSAGKNWLKVLDERNISYIAWNISNSKGSSSILKQGNSTMTEFVDANLKEWGIYLRQLYRSKAGLSE